MKAISFSLWGSDHTYTFGAIKNIYLADLYYPGWKCIFYIDDSVPKNIVDSIIYDGGIVKYKDRSKGYFGLYWRYEVAFDDCKVERFLIRDCDSRINEREADAVKEWEESGSPFHVMRDHAYHSVPILGGMWGAVNRSIPFFKDLYFNWISTMSKKGIKGGINRGEYFGTDQDFFEGSIWPLIKDSHIAHDDLKRFTGLEKCYPTKLQNEYFVGQQFDENDKPLLR
jgi:protein O-GlcNAc transferase